MKKLILPLLLISALSSSAQKESIYGFGALPTPNQWKSIQAFSAEENTTFTTIYDGTKAFQLSNGNARRNISGFDAVNVAAAGYAAGSRQIFFIPLDMPELRWVYSTNSSETPVFSAVRSSLLERLDLTKTENQITRMTVNKQGVGYAMTNDAMHLFEFSTGDNPVIRDLGAIIDASSNGQMSIHQTCTSFGGDMVAGDDGKLYLISLRNHIFEIDPVGRIANYIGAIKGLPNSFTSNGAAALSNGDLILSSSFGNQGFYTVNPMTWESKKLFTGEQYEQNMSDLASGYLLARRPRTLSNGNDGMNAGTNGSIHVYPNPLNSGKDLQFTTDIPLSGDHQIQLIDLSGKIIENQKITLTENARQFNVRFTSQFTQGTYFIKLSDMNGKTVETSKLIIQ
jgi:hypothetical protein